MNLVHSQITTYAILLTYNKSALLFVSDLRNSLPSRNKMHGNFFPFSRYYLINSPIFLSDDYQLYNLAINSEIVIIIGGGMFCFVTF